MIREPLANPTVQHNGNNEAARRVLTYPKNGLEYGLTGGHHHFVVTLDQYLAKTFFKPFIALSTCFSLRM